MSQDDLWYVRVDGEGTVGPVTLDQLRRGVAAGRVPDTAMVNLLGSPEWLPVLSVVRSAQPLAPHGSPTPPVAPGAQGERWLRLVGVAGVVGVVAIVAGAVLLLRGRAAPAGGGPTASAAPRLAHLPPPFGALRIGMSAEEVRRAFPPVEPWESCTSEVLGSEPPGAEVPDQGKNAPHSTCPSAEGKARVTTDEKLASMELGAASDSPTARAMTTFGFWTAARQVRAVVRAGSVTRAEVASFHRGRGGRAGSPVAMAAAELLDGSMTFVRPRPARRPICATVKEDCTGLDVDRIRRYMAGGFSLGELDAAARARVSNGRCLGQYLAREREFQVEFVSITGGLAGIGLARSSQPGRALDPARPATYAVFKARSGLNPDVAAFGVRVANGLEATKAYFAGAIELHVGNAAPSALVWLRDGLVSRVLMNLDGATPGLQEELSSLYGGPPDDSGTEQTWQVDAGAVTARLDTVVTMSLLLERSVSTDTSSAPRRPTPRSESAPAGTAPAPPRSSTDPLTER